MSEGLMSHYCLPEYCDEELKYVPTSMPVLSASAIMELQLPPMSENYGGEVRVEEQSPIFDAV